LGTFRQMAYWLAIVEEGSFTRAAARMHVSQPSLSQQVRALEEELGGELLERLPRSVRLTSAGKAFLPHARAAVNSAERAVRSAREALQLKTGELEISTVRSIAVGLLPDVIHAWRERYPGTYVRLHEFTHRRLAEDAVREGVSDFGIGPPPLRWTGPVCRLGWEEFKIVLPLDDDLAGRDAISLADLSEREWVMFDADNGLYDLVVAACATGASPPFMPRPAVLTSQVEAAARLASAGVGPALVPENALPSDLRAAVVRAHPPIGRELTVYARADWTPLGKAFLELMRARPWQHPPLDATVIA
jgi:DNA-binding transcriptional LysR family regulator